MFLDDFGEQCGSSGIGKRKGRCGLDGERLQAVIQQKFIEQLLCARHSTEHWDTNMNLIGP